MKQLNLLIFLIVIAGSAFTLKKLVAWKLKGEYTVRFSWPQQGNNGEIITMEGSFKGLKATILFDEEHPEKSKITASIDPKTVNTGNGRVNGNTHAKTALEIEKFPTITFTSTAIKRTKTEYLITGYLTIKDVTKKFVFPFTFDTKDTPGKFPFFATNTFMGGFTIEPKEFNISMEGLPNKIRVDLTIPVTM